jgi:hypothetical protein
MSSYVKSPGASLDYAIDWRAPKNIAEWFINPIEFGGLVVAASEISGALASARLSGGISGHVYQVRCRAHAADGQTHERSLSIRVEQI